MKNIVIIPAWKRAEFLAVATEHLRLANGADRNVYLFAIDRNFGTDVDFIAKAFPLEKTIKYAANHRFNGNTYNVLEAYKYALALAPRYQSELIYLIEEDIFVGRDFFDFHERVNQQFDGFCVSGVRNQNDSRSTPGGVIPDPSYVYRFGKYQSLGISWKPCKLKTLLPHCKMEYYASMKNYLVRNFPKSDYGQNWSEQDGMINRVMEQGKYEAIYPSIPRAYHAGFVGYNRKGNPITGRLEDRIAALKEMSAEQMNSRAEVYKDITPIDLAIDHGISNFRMEK